MENLDEAGYVRIALEDIAERMDCPLSHVESVLRHMQGFEPTGIFRARPQGVPDAATRRNAGVWMVR